MLKDLLCCLQPRPTKSKNCAWGLMPHAPEASTIKVMAQCSNYVPGGHPCNRKIGAMNSVIRECALLLMAVIGWTELALARSYLNCLAKKVVIVDTPRGSTSSSVEEHLGL